VLKVAWADAFSVLVLMEVAPSRKVTVPVGVPGEADETVAVKVTFWPEDDGFAEEVSAVLVLALPLTAKASTWEALSWGLPESITWIVILLVLMTSGCDGDATFAAATTAAVGVPEMRPVLLLSERPAGREPEVIDQVNGETPPTSVS